MSARVRRWLMALVALAGAVSLRRTFSHSPGATGLVLGVIAPIVCLVAAIAVILLAGRVRRVSP